ncbi:XRE family transcriptional regulator [Algoriphagus namhaensis]|uniref:XRE family transcriptional regulator n=1 Tax=Algoriphagus namhaensis TaxID=915353 RepID=A0ABV8AT92_9BACT
MRRIATNISFLRKKKGLTQEQLAEELGITRSRIGSYEEGRSEPSIDILILISGYFQLPIDALVRHDLSLSKNKSFIDIGSQRVLFPIIMDGEEKDLIEVISAKASAGYLNGYSDPEFIEQLEKIRLPFLPSGKHRAFPIKGDSMLPLKDGSFVIARFLESIQELHEGKTYVLLTAQEGIVYKRVYRKDAESLLLHSDNKDYAPYTVKLEEVLELWEFSCSINMSDFEEKELKISHMLKVLKEMQEELENLS